MEVHAHTHTARKRWTHYFWEFLMLFLAVTLGFFVENKREHYIEKQRAKEYARLLVDDLNADVTELNRAESVLNKIIAAGDSLGLLLASPDISRIPGGKLYYYEYWSGWQWRIISRDATLQQLKNSGAMRYLHNSRLVRKILGYEESIRVIYMLQDKYQPEKNENSSLALKVFYQEYFNILDNDPAMTRDSTSNNFLSNYPGINSFMNASFPLNTYDKDMLFELKNRAYSSSRNYRVIVKDIQSVRAKAYGVMEALKEEFRLD